MYYSKIIFISILFLFNSSVISAQDGPISPSKYITGVYLGETPPLRDMPVLTEADMIELAEQAEQNMHNEELQSRSYPYAETALPKGLDPAWQKLMGASRGSRAPVMNFNGQNTTAAPPDCNGTVGPNHYMQTINVVYAIYDKNGTLAAGPSNLNTLFTGVTGSECNNGDPIVLFDEQADRWLVAEFSLCGSTDYMLIAVSTTNDPTGTWHKYSFDVDDMPDYEKFGIWQDGYYMGTNNSSGNDIYVFERSQMLIGGTAQAVGFNNPWRPTTIDGFMCVPPLDNDGPFAPAGEPGLFITLNDDAIAGGSDQLWIYELDVDWADPGSSTFDRVQQLNVPAFDSNFGSNWDNIKQLGTSQELDAIPQVIMNPPQYRNFGTYETIVCCHTVDVDNTDHAGIRWYELRRVSSGDWTIRQNGTYAPDDHSRWMGSIMLNGFNEIGLGYSVSSATMYPGIRYCGQSQAEYIAASGIMDIAEENIQNSLTYQSSYNRWGDYSGMQVDPANDSTFWFTTEYIGSGGSRKTKIASFNLGPDILNADFYASDLAPGLNTTVNFINISSGGPTAWNWSVSPSDFIFVGGTTDSSQAPKVQFNSPGLFTVTLIISDGADSDTVTKSDYINAIDCTVENFPFTEDFSDGALPYCWQNIDNQGSGQVWQFNNPGARPINTSTSGNGFAILDSDLYGSGNSQDADLVTPPLDLFSYNSINLSFQHYFQSYAGSSGTLSYSIDGGNTWTAIQTWTATTANAETFSQDLSSQVAGHAGVKFKWNYTGTWGYYWAIDDFSITGTTSGIWTGTVSSEWNNPDNWNDNAIPGDNINITISPTADFWPDFDGDFALGTHCDNIIIKNNAEMTINGNLSIPFGQSLIFQDTGTLIIAGNFSNKGSFIPASGTIEFTAPSASSVSGWTAADHIISNYTRSAFPKGMTMLEGATTGPTGQNGYTDVSIGFTFKYAGVNYSNARISTNGWVTLNLSGTSAYNNALLFSTSLPNTTLAPWYDYLIDDAVSTISYKTSGTPPYRVFTAEWLQVPTYRILATSRISFQLKLYETINHIEFLYGDFLDETHNGNESASIGLEDAIGGSGHFIEGTTGSNTAVITSLNSQNDWPTANYRFSPPPEELIFRNIFVNNPGGILNFNINTIVISDFNIMPGGRFNVSAGKTLKVE